MDIEPLETILNIYKNDKINKRSTWHPHCADEYMMIYHPGETRKRIWQIQTTGLIKDTI